MKPIRWIDALSPDWAARALLFVFLVGVAGMHIAALYPLQAESLGEPYPHFDATIPLAVADHVIASGAPDTNWANAPTMPEHFKYTQYNFSSFNLVFAYFASFFGNSMETLALFSLLAAIAGLLTYTLWTGVRLGPIPAAFLAAALVSTPLLVQDSLYGRPEMFLAALIGIALAASTGRSRATAAIAGLAAGLALATKISVAPFVLAAFLAPVARDGVSAWPRLLIVGLGAAAGFAAGAPFAVLNPGDFLSGVTALREQYAGFHAPHGSYEAGLLPQGVHAASYFLATMGPLIWAAALVGCGLLCWNAVREEQDRPFALFALAALATLILFSTQRTFFERNVSHAIPVLWAAAAWGLWFVLARFKERPIALSLGIAAAAALTIAPMAAMSLKVSEVIVLGPDYPTAVVSRDMEAALSTKAQGPVLLKFAYLGEEAPSVICDALREAPSGTLLKLVTHRGRAKGPAVSDLRVDPAGVSHGPFEAIPVSTLHAYHAARVEFYWLRPEAPPAPKPAGCG